MTSWPASTARAAATAESTPPDMAARTRILSRPSSTRRSRRRRRPPGPASRPGRSPRRARRRRPGCWCAPARTAASCAPAPSSQPIASSTWEGCGTPAEQADPVERGDAAGVEQHQQRVALAAGEGEVRVAGEPARHAVRRGAVEGGVAATCSLDPAHQVVAQRGHPLGVLGLALDGEPTAAAKPAMAGVSMVPERMSRSWPPPCSCGVTSRSRRTTSAPTPYGPPSLVRGQGQRVDAAGREVDRHLADRLHGVGVHRDVVGVRRARRPRRPAGRCRPRCWPTSPRPGRPSAGSRSSEARRASRSRRPSGRPAAARRRRPRARRASAAGRGRRGARPPWTAPGCAAGPRRGGPRTGP